MYRQIAGSARYHSRVDLEASADMIWAGADPNYRGDILKHAIIRYEPVLIRMLVDAGVTVEEGFLDSGKNGEAAEAIIKRVRSSGPSPMKNALRYVETALPRNEFIANFRSSLAYDVALRDNLTYNSSIGGAIHGVEVDLTNQRAPLSHSDVIYVAGGYEGVNYMAAMDALATSLDNCGAKREFVFSGFEDTDEECTLKRVLMSVGQVVR